MELRIYIRQRKTFDVNGNEIYYSGNNPFNLLKVQGTLPQSRQLPNYHNWINVTSDVSDLNKLKLTWTEQRDKGGNYIPAGQEQKKTATGTLSFENEAYAYLKKWLIDDPSAFNNQIEVQIEHVGCGYYTDWVINANDLEWCDDDICVFDVLMKQTEDAYQCIRNTLITDDWQGWFGENSRPSSGKTHPRFSYCVEKRPNTLLVVLWWTITQLMSLLGPFVILLGLIFALINVIISVINAIIRAINSLGFNIDEINPLPTFKELKEVYANFFVESAGCGREHPAPLIRDYISNVCDKCGITVDRDTAPIFFNNNIDIETSHDRFYPNDRPLSRYNHHVNACYLSAVSKKGIRRFDSLSLFNGVSKNTTDYWIPENSPLLTLDEFLDQLKTLYNAHWRIVDNKLYFQRKDYWIDNVPAFDFTKGSPDREYLLKGLCYTWNEQKYPALIEGLYTPDAADVAGNAALGYYDDIVGVGNIDENPNFDGTLKKTTPFGAAKFRLDGADNDYILDALQVVTKSTLITGSVWTPTLMGSVDGFISQYGDYALLMSDEVTTLPKVIIWNGGFDEGLMINSKAHIPYYASIIAGNTPVPNPPYNNFNGTKLWEQAHPPDTKVLGNKAHTSGIYEVNLVVNFNGSNRIRKPARLVNYPMYMGVGFRDTMWDWFHWIDDPRFTPSVHKTVTARLDLCCDILNRAKVFKDSADIILGQKITTDGVNGEGYITKVEVNYDPEEEDGMYLEITANL